MWHRLLDVGTSLAVGYLGRCPPLPACPPCPACALSCAALSCPAAPPCPACPQAFGQAAPAVAPAPAPPPAAEAASAGAPCVCLAWPWLLLGLLLGVIVTLGAQFAVGAARRLLIATVFGRGSVRPGIRDVPLPVDVDVVATPSSLRRRNGGGADA